MGKKTQAKYQYNLTISKSIHLSESTTVKGKYFVTIRYVNETDEIESKSI